MNPEIAKITSICTSPGSHYSTFVSIVHKYLRKISEEYWLFIIFILIFLETLQDGLMTFRNSIFPNYRLFLLRCTDSSSDEFFFWFYFESMVLTQKLKLRFCWKYEIFHCISSCSLKEKVCMCFVAVILFCFPSIYKASLQLFYVKFHRPSRILPIFGMSIYSPFFCM